MISRPIQSPKLAWIDVDSTEAVRSPKESLVSGLEYGTFVSRALRLRCPRCGVGVLFKNLIMMHDRCPNCGLKYERAPGYFLGSTYINYGFMAITVTSLYMLLHYGASISNETLTIPLMIYCTVVPIFLFPVRAIMVAGNGLLLRSDGIRRTADRWRT